MRARAILILTALTGILLIGSGLYWQILDSKSPQVKNKTPIVTPQSALQSTSEEKATQPTSEEIIQTDTVVITQVFDGDTVKAKTGEIIRLLGINAPETGQPYSSKATQFLKETLLNRPVQLTYDLQTKDRYGRTLAYLYSGSLFVNSELIRRGLAVIETINPNVMQVDEFKSALDEAKRNCVGMWEGLCSENATLGSSTSCITVSSINANPPGDDNTKKNEEWIEIKNSCDYDKELTNWLLKDNSASNSYQFKVFTLSANSSVRIHSGCGADSSTDIYWKCPEGKYAVWNNSGDHAYLYNENGNLVADYQY